MIQTGRQRLLAITNATFGSSLCWAASDMLQINSPMFARKSPASNGSISHPLAARITTSWLAAFCFVFMFRSLLFQERVYHNDIILIDIYLNFRINGLSGFGADGSPCALPPAESARNSEMAGTQTRKAEAKC